ncbi:UNVERIFIED_CONTAM: hypothetical protein FKN15_002449 [Acipenser sinensis]
MSTALQPGSSPKLSQAGPDHSYDGEYPLEMQLSEAGLGLTCSCKVRVLLSLPAALDVQVPEDPVVARFGSDVTLNCSFFSGSAFNLSDLSIFWHLTDTKRPVHSFSSGQDQDEGGSYSNRTQLYLGELGSGNASLLLRRVQIQDEGSFTCFVRIREYNSAALLLQVAASYSKPQLTLEPDSNLRPGDEVSVSCLAYGGYPQASVLWQDGKGANLTENVTTSQVASDEGLFNVWSVLRVMLEPNSTYSCVVRNPVLGEETHASVTITASYSKPQLTLEPDSNLRPGDEVSVSCLAYGGYPQASVLWQDGKGANLTENVTTSQVASDEGLFNVWSVLRVMLEPNSTYSCVGANLTENVTTSQVASDEGLFNVWSVLRVMLEPNSTYSCVVRNPVLGEESHASVTITGQHMSFPPLALWVTVGLAVCLLGLLIALAYICRHKIRESCKEGPAVEQGQETEDEESKTGVKAEVGTPTSYCRLI